MKVIVNSYRFASPYPVEISGERYELTRNLKTTAHVPEEHAYLIQEMEKRYWCNRSGSWRTAKPFSVIEE